MYISHHVSPETTKFSYGSSKDFPMPLNKNLIKDFPKIATHKYLNGLAKDNFCLFRETQNHLINMIMLYTSLDRLTAVAPV